jgi:hypothetical protein
MERRRTLSTAAVFLLLVACSDGAAPNRPHPTVRASASPSIPVGARSAVTSLSGRIVFDNFHDVWSINANGTGLTRPGPRRIQTPCPEAGLSRKCEIVRSKAA